MNDTVSFGYEQVSPEEKTKRVGGVFSNVARKYDIMNDAMSGGMHRLWKAYTITASGVRPGHKVLDIAGGTGDLSEAFAKRVGPSGMVVHTDINLAMLSTGRDRLINSGMAEQLVQVQKGGVQTRIMQHAEGK